MSTVTHVMNQNPLLTKFLVKTKSFAEEPLTVVDCGAKGGFENHWDWYKEQVLLLGFEPNIAEYKKLCSESRQNRRYFPTALSDKKGNRTLRVCELAAATSFLKPNFRFLDRLPSPESLALKKKIRVPTDTIDSLMRSAGITAVDFMKIDTQGTELEVLQGAKRTLRLALGVTLECSFNPFYEGERTFTDVDRFLKPLGFSLFRLPTFHYARTALSVYQGRNIHHHTNPSGQVCWGEALYLRDAVDDIRHGKAKLWTRLRILKLVSLMELFSLADCAIELIYAGANIGRFNGSERRAMTELLIPDIDGAKYPYREYIRYIKRTHELKFLIGMEKEKLGEPRV